VRPTIVNAARLLVVAPGAEGPWELHAIALPIAAIAHARVQR
jgi:hypothetical protein